MCQYQWIKLRFRRFESAEENERSTSEVIPSERLVSACSGCETRPSVSRAVVSAAGCERSRRAVNRVTKVFITVSDQRFSHMASDTSETDQWENVEVSRDGHVGRITLSRPEAMNTFSTGLAQDLDAALHTLDEDPDTRAIVVEGAGKTFSAGIDLSEHGDHEAKSEYEEWVTRMEEPFHTLTEMRTPVVAAAHGHAAANGIGLVAACDLAVADEGTQFGATAPKVGLFCMGPAVPLMNALNRKRCLELILTGELIDAETALEWGLINRVVPEGDHLETAMELAETMASKSPTAVQMGKRAFYEMVELDYDDALEYSNERFAALCTTDDAHAGIEAFLDGEPLSADEWPET